VSDPGSALITAALAGGAPVVAIPGPSAVTTAAAASGLVSGGFLFVGFLARSGVERADALTRIASTREPVILFESAQRLAETLRELGALMPGRRAVVAREMTKVHEELVRGTLAELGALEREWLGEITVVIGPDAGAGAVTVSDEAIDERIDRELAAGASVKVVAQRVAAWCGRPRREMYERALRKTSRS
jgi:16S rRNA (cytidine1402-2'-O)-methyltransferase